MFKKMTVLFLAVAFLGTGFSYAQTSIQEKLAVLDENRHAPADFAEVIDYIHAYHPTYSDAEIGELLIQSFSEIQKRTPDVAMYDVAINLKTFCRDELGIDLKEFIVAYTKAQLYRY